MESWYDAKEDVLNIKINDKPYWKSVELSNGVVIDIAKDGTILSFEILSASKVFCGDTAQVLSKAVV